MRHYLTLPSGSVHLRVEGRGPALLVLVDWPLPGSVASDLVGELARDWTVLAPDSPGYGQSPAQASVHDLEDHARVIAELLRELGVARCAVLGTGTGKGSPGLGAVLALALAAHAREVVDSVIVDELPEGAELRALDGDLLWRSHEPEQSGAHLLETWVEARDATIFAPWYERRADARLHSAVPDARTLHRRVVEILTAGNGWPEGPRAALRFDVDTAVRSLPAGVVRVLPQGTPVSGSLHHDAAARPDLDHDRLSRRLVDAGSPRRHDDGHSRHYLRTGAGLVHVRLDGDRSAMPVMLLHPSPGSADTYRDVIEDLATDFLVVGMDLIGNGYSDKSPEPEPRIDHYANVAAEALAEAASELGLPPAIVFGSHTGASVALEVAARRPQLVRGLVVEGLPHFTGDEQADVLARYTPSFEPVPSGAHLVTNWHMLRDMHLFWPWYATTAAGVRRSAPDLASLHNLFVQMLKTGATYPLAYRAAFLHDPRPAVLALHVPALFVAHPADMLRSSTEELAAPADLAEFVELAPAEGRGPAWAVRELASRLSR